MYFAKIKNFCSVKDMIMKSRNTHWEDTFSNYISQQGLVLRLYEDLSKTQQKENNPLKMGTSLKCFTQEDIRKANKHINRCLTSLVVRNMQIKATTGYQLYIYYNG